MLLAAAAPAQRITLEIGAKLSDKYRQASKESLATAMAQFWPTVSIMVNRIRYTVGFDKETGVIRYIKTTDAKFKTRSGSRIGDVLTVTSADVNENPGFEVRATPIDGWEPVIDEYAFILGPPLRDDYSKVLTDLQTQKEVKVKILGFIKGH